MLNLCYIVYTDLFIMAFWFTDNFQWPMPNSIYIIFDQNDGRVVGLPITIIISFFQGYSQWEDGGGPEKDQKLL